LSSLKRKSAVALAWDFGGLLAKKGFGFVISIFLARLLTPEDFGVVGMAMVFIAISQVFVDVGFSSSLIQRSDCTDLTYSSVFYFNIVSGSLLTLIFFFTAPLIGDFYNNDQITLIVKWLSLSFLLNSFNQVQSAILKKELNFKVLSLRLVFASAIAGTIGIIAAYNGLGVYALVIQSLSSAVLSTILLWSISNWKPSFRFSIKELKSLTGFSVYVFLDSITSTFFNKMDVLFVGKVFSSATLGFYSRAESLNSQISTFTSTSLIKVFFPVLSSLKDADKDFKRVYFKVVSLICFLSFILSGILYALAEPLIIGLFGEKWHFSVAIFQILVFKSFNVPLNGIMLNALLGKGKAKENFRIGIIRKVLRASPIIIGWYYGLMAFVWGVTIISFVLTFFNIVFLNRYVNISIYYHLRKIIEGIIPFILFVFTINYFELTTYKELMVSSIIYVIFYLLYATVIKMDGLIFVKSEIKKRLNK